MIGKSTWTPSSPSRDWPSGSRTRHYHDQVGHRRLAKTVSLPAQHAADVTAKSQRSDLEAIRRRRVDQTHLSTDIPESSVVHEQDETDPKKDRPISRGEFLRKYASLRLLALNEGEIAALTLVMRKLGVDSQGGGEAPTIFHQLLYDVWTAGSLSIPLARIKVDEKNCCGTIEWKAVREAARQLLPENTAPAGWKHRALSCVEQEGLPPMPTDLCA